ncbi:hypothetical protein [[Mycobacterium] burgundiense]|uniref:Transmembrane protein n=1 Tax=[Mycobacterium] burgundiense TaxID=3064286 RepID=A0ABM9LFW9_9MYCO|nr:hypothetical protein [Mycolicibacterium sp. MU0053]CAJ1498276.1 hypothetical protein MU0053_001118 [Mycolicibacterium sp. MU0053]
MSAAGAVAAGAIFFWLGMVAAISFLEAPLKFRAPGVTLPIGLGIGRLVFRALNACEMVLAVLVVVALVLGSPSVTTAVAAGVAIVALLIQVLAVRPRLTRRSNAVLAGAAESEQRSRVHFVYLGLELIKVLGLIVAGVLLLAG